MRNLLVTTTMFFFCLSAQAAIIDFEPPPCNTCGFGKTSWSEDGFSLNGRFTHFGAGVWNSSNTFNNGSRGALRFPISPESGFELTVNNGDLFDLNSVELANYGGGNSTINVTFIG
ncbi:MAG: hypothetical protein ACR2QG_07675, partial [Gammaproteobacteria bacterium]